MDGIGDRGGYIESVDGAENAINVGTRVPTTIKIDTHLREPSQ